MTQAIPKEVLDREHRSLLRRMAAVIILEMAETDISFKEMDARLGKKPGSSQRWLNKFLTGDTNEARIVSDLVCALGGRMEVGVRRIEFNPPVTQPAAEEIPSANP